MTATADGEPSAAGFTDPVCDMEVTAGAPFGSSHAPGVVDYPMSGVFREVVQPEQQVFTK
jgi:hypothetical protein